MKIIGINGSPRKNWNTSTLLQKVLDGAASEGFETELVNLYDLKYRGCISCFACKKKGGKHGVCAMQDDLTPLLETLKVADVIAFGSPIYLMNVTSGMFALLERFLFSNFLYNKENSNLYPKQTPSAFIYTSGAPKEMLEEYGIKARQATYQNRLKLSLGIQPEVLYSCDTYQFSDYAQYETSMFSEPDKAKHRAEQFPIDCNTAYKLGAELALKALKSVRQES